MTKSSAVIVAVIVATTGWLSRCFYNTFLTMSKHLTTNTHCWSCIILATVILNAYHTEWHLSTENIHCAFPYAMFSVAMVPHLVSINHIDIFVNRTYSKYSELYSVQNIYFVLFIF